MTPASPAVAHARTSRSGENLWAALRHGLTPSPAVKHAIRLGTATSFALWLAYFVNLPKPTWPLITVLVVAQPGAGASIQKGMLRITGTMMAAVAGIVIYGAFAQNHLMLAISISLVFAAAVYGMTGPRHGYAWNVFGFTTGIILGGAMPGTNPVEIVAFDRVSLVLLGLVASFAAEAIFWPVRAEPQLRASLAARLEELADAMSRSKSTLLGESGPGDAAPQSAGSSLLDQLVLVDQLRGEMGVGPIRARAFLRLVLDAEAISSCIRSLDADSQAPAASLPAPLEAALDTVLSQLVDALGGLQQWLGDGARPEPAADALREAMRTFDDERLAHLAAVITREERGELSGDTPDPRMASHLRRITPLISRAIDVQADMESALETITDDDAPAKDTPSARHTAPLRSLSLKVDPLRRELAMRAGIAVGSVFVVMPLLGWEVSSTPMILAFLVAAMPTRTALMRGTMACGAVAIATWVISDLSIVFLVPHMGQMPGALAYPLVVAGLAGYAAVRFPAIGALMPTMALIAILSVFGGASPPTNVEGPYLTTMILFMGIAIGMVAQLLLWPRTAAELFLIRGAGLLELCADTLAPTTRRTEESREQSLARALVGSAQQIALMTQMHTQAAVETVDGALDDARRGKLMTVLEEAFQASIQTGPLAARAGSLLGASHSEELGPLLSTLESQDEAMLRSLVASIACLEKEAEPATSGLAETQTRVEEEIEALRGRSGLIHALGDRGVDTFIAHIEDRRRLAARVRAVEAWIEDWKASEGAS